MMKILVTGAAGQLGFELCRILGDAAIATTRKSLDLSDPTSCRTYLEKTSFDVLINCAAYTAVDRAETERDACFAINARCVELLSEICSSKDAKLVQISTDYVFDDNLTQVPRRETDPVSPQGVYAASKLASEQFAITYACNLVVRTCGLYGNAPRGKNFVATMLRIGGERECVRVVDDQHCCPSYAVDVAQAILRLIEHDATGLFHVANRGVVTWCEFARKIFLQAGLPTQVEAITTTEFAAPAKRPAYSALDTTRYQATTHHQLPSIDEALANYFHEHNLVNRKQ